MIDILIPDFGHLTLHALVMDYNGTLAEDGILIDDPVDDRHMLRVDDTGEKSGGRFPIR